MRNAQSQNYGETIRAQTDDFAQSMYFQEDDFVVVDRLTSLAEQRGISNAQMALAWLLHKPGVTSPIIGASKMRHLEEAVAAVDLQLTTEEIAALEAPYRPHPVLGHS
jgi:aryl-alcohol dehydrogenase (NADP+)